MTKSLKYGIAVAAALLVLVFIFRACSIIDRSSERIGELEVTLNHAKAENSVLIEERKGLNQEIDKLNERLKKILEDIGKPTPAEVEKDKTIAAQAKEIEKWKKLGDCPKALEAAESQIKNWSEKFSLAEERHSKSIGALNAAWDEKYKKQVGISESWEKTANNEKATSAAAIKAISSLQWDLRKARLFGTVKSGLVIGLAGYVLYGLVKGK